MSYLKDQGLANGRVNVYHKPGSAYNEAEKEWRTNPLAYAKKHSDLAIALASCVDGDVLQQPGWSWYLFEPYIEVTWVCPIDCYNAVVHRVKHTLDVFRVPKSNYEIIGPEHGQFASWYHKNKSEFFQTIHMHHHLAALTRHFMWNHKNIEAGYGIEKQYLRATHLLANMLGINNFREGHLKLRDGAKRLIPEQSLWDTTTAADIMFGRMPDVANYEEDKAL